METTKIEGGIGAATERRSDGEKERTQSTGPSVSPSPRLPITPSRPSAEEAYALQTSFVPAPAEASLNARIDARLKQALDDAVFIHRRQRTGTRTQRSVIEAALREWLAKHGQPKAA